MRYSLQTKHISLTDLDRQQLEEKLNRLGKLIRLPYAIDIMISHDTHHSRGRVVTCRINVEEGKQLFHAQRTGASIQDALDETLEALKRELRKSIQKRRDLERRSKNR